MDEEVTQNSCSQLKSTFHFAFLVKHSKIAQNCHEEQESMLEYI